MCTVTPLLQSDAPSYPYLEGVPRVQQLLEDEPWGEQKPCYSGRSQLGCFVVVSASVRVYFNNNTVKEYSRPGGDTCQL